MSKRIQIIQNNDYLEVHGKHSEDISNILKLTLVTDKITKCDMCLFPLNSAGIYIRHLLSLGYILIISDEHTNDTI